MAEDACDNCHLSNGEPHPLEGVRAFDLMDTIPALCFYCHMETEPLTHGHDPVVEGDCLACHKVHGSSEISLLKESEVNLCITCHGASDDPQRRSSNIRKYITGNRIIHTAISSGGCIVCHLPHGSNVRAMLAAHYPEGTYVSNAEQDFELCLMCHDTDLIMAEDTEWGTNFRDGTRNLHWVHCQGSKGRNCRLCHNLHGSPLPFLIEERVTFGEWEMNMQFERANHGGSCLPGCHGLLQYRRE